MISSLVTLYLLARDIDPDPDGAVMVTVLAEHDDDHDILMLKIGIGDDANTVMTVEHDAGHAARDDRGGGA